jgi:hypothetical protein
MKRRLMVAVTSLVMDVVAAVANGDGGQDNNHGLR